MLPSFCKLIIAVRSSPLSRAQFAEFASFFYRKFPEISLEPLFLQTKGDKDKKTSLRAMGKTNFFTEELDNLVLEKKCEGALHSAKDVPCPLPKGLCQAFLSKGVDSRDVLVMKKKGSWKDFSFKALVGVSSERREKMVQHKRGDLRCFDIRGTIEERLALLEKKGVEGIVVAEAALIRLKKTYLPRLFFEEQTESLQGKLSLLVHKERKDLQQLFSKVPLA